MKRPFVFSILKVLAVAAALFQFQSCSKDAENDFTAIDDPLSASELRTVIQADQWTGAMDEVLLDLFEKHTGPAAKLSDEGCYDITYTDSGFRAVFGNCVLNATDKVNGILEVVYTAGPEAPSFTATFTDFFVGAIQLTGKRTLTVEEAGASDLRFLVQSEMTVLLEDGTLLAEKGSKSLEVRIGATLEDTTYALSGSWTVSAEGTTYGVSTEEPLSGNLQCRWATSGLLALIKNGLEVRVDFGDGSCDNQVTLIYPNGATQEREL